jgi:hypothetical protein
VCPAREPTRNSSAFHFSINEDVLAASSREIAVPSSQCIDLESSGCERHERPLVRLAKGSLERR